MHILQYSKKMQGKETNKCAGIVVCSLHVMHRYEKLNLYLFSSFSVQVDVLSEQQVVHRWLANEQKCDAVVGKW